MIRLHKEDDAWREGRERLIDKNSVVKGTLPVVSHVFGTIAHIKKLDRENTLTEMFSNFLDCQLISVF